MIKIIKQGIPQYKTVLENHCEKCKCIYSFELSDLKTYSDQYDHSIEYYIVCPNCSKEIWYKQNPFNNY